jgi:ATP-dependent RNA helicase RhlE
MVSAWSQPARWSVHARRRASGVTSSSGNPPRGPAKREEFAPAPSGNGGPAGVAISPVVSVHQGALHGSVRALQRSTEHSFETLGLIEPILAAVREEGYEHPTPIQGRAIPHVLAGKDLLGLAQTGTGKTAAFALPILQRLTEGASAARRPGRRPIRTLVLTPTRELASQIAEAFNVYGKNLGLRCAVIFGGVGHEPQRQMLRVGVDILIATPGRFLDLAGERLIDLSALEVFVLDEADRMLDMGFIHDVKRVIAMLPRVRQTLFFSATMPPEAKKLADVLLKADAETVAVTPVSSTVERIDQSLYFVEKAQKRAMLEDILYDNADITRVLVFTRTKHGANRVAEHLEDAGERAAAIHGNKSQSARERALANFKDGSIRVLVATDIAARGIDIDEISHVINFDLPEVPETYVHRIGRTARAGADGVAISMCDVDELDLLRDIEKLIRKPVPVAEGHEPPAWARNRSTSGPSGPRMSPMQRGRADLRDNGGGRDARGGGGGGRSGGGGRGGGGGGPRGGNGHGGGNGHSGGGRSAGGGGERPAASAPAREGDRPAMRREGPPPVRPSAPAQGRGHGPGTGQPSPPAQRPPYGGGGGGGDSRSAGGGGGGGGGEAAGRRRRRRRGGGGGGPRPVGSGSGHA